MIAYSVWRLPYTLRSCHAAMLQIHESYEEEAMNLGANRIAGRVARATYLGALLQYDVEVASGRIFRVNVPNPRQVEVLPEGAEVQLAYSPGDAVLLDRCREEVD